MALDPAYWRHGPLRFGQVREDANTERALAIEHGAVRRAVVIASAGDTALSLVDVVAERLFAVDINAAQIALTRLKWTAVRQLELASLRNLLFGPAAEAQAALRLVLTDESYPLRPRIPNGLQNSGRVDAVLATLRRALFLTVHPRTFVRDFLGQNSPARQAERFDREWNTPIWQLATAIAFNPLVLQIGWGKAVRKNLPGSFANILRERIRRSLTRTPCATNGYLWQAFLGEMPDGIDKALPVYTHSSVASRLSKLDADRMETRCCDVVQWLTAQPAAQLDFFAMSNILELTGAKRVADLIREVERCAATGSIVCFRGILPLTNPPFPEQYGRLAFDPELTRKVEEIDQSVICNFFRIYRCQ